MANCAIYVKDTDEITYFIRDCIQTGMDFRGSNGSATGVKEHLFDVMWTDDLAEPIFDSEGKQTGYNKRVSELSEAKRYQGRVVSTKEDVDRVTLELIAEKYPANEETKLLRLKLSGAADREFTDYHSFVDDLVKQGREFKAREFGRAL